MSNTDQQLPSDEATGLRMHEQVQPAGEVTGAPLPHRDRAVPTRAPRQINQLAVPFVLSERTAELQRQLNAAIADINLKWRNHAKELAKTRQLEITEPNGTVFHDLAGMLNREAFTLLGRTRSLLMDIGNYYLACEGDLLVARENASQAHEKASADLRGDLLEIGYADGLMPGGPQVCLVPIFFHHHPGVLETRQANDAVAAISLDPGRNANAEALRQVNQEIETIRNKITHSTGV